MNFDPRLSSLGVAVKTNPNATWSLASAQYQDEAQAGGNHHIYFTVLDSSGRPSGGIPCVVDWVGREPRDKPTVTLSDPHQLVNFPMYANLDLTAKNGPYFAFIGDQDKSDVVTGMGLPELRHVNFLLTFAAKAEFEPPPRVPPQITLEQAVLAAALKYLWMPIDLESALYQFAQANNLGFPQTDEFRFAFGGDTYVGQVYNLGIVYLKWGEWTNVKWVKKP
jgi:hypothetical protein